MLCRYRKEAAVIKSKQDFMQPEFDDEGRASVEAIGEWRKISAVKHQ